MTQNFGIHVLKIFTIVLGTASLVVLITGILRQEYFFGFGLVMFMTSLVCCIAAFLGDQSTR